MTPSEKFTYGLLNRTSLDDYNSFDNYTNYINDGYDSYQDFKSTNLNRAIASSFGNTRRARKYWKHYTEGDSSFARLNGSTVSPAKVVYHFPYATGKNLRSTFERYNMFDNDSNSAD